MATQLRKSYRFASRSALFITLILCFGGLPLAWLAWVHVAAAFALILFLIVHVYMAGTTGKPWYSYLRAMFTDGYEEV